MQIKCNEGNDFKAYFPPAVSSGLKKNPEHKRKWLYFLSWYSAAIQHESLYSEGHYMGFVLSGCTQPLFQQQISGKA